ncbi:MAG TPA: pyridoxamine 5'-phosphate oxidase family protein [Acidimicrobiales bacterium]|nr:pyridoxamine 5'-phosphate oxidase family protein [Acidimicrobiales bacterium]
MGTKDPHRDVEYLGRAECWALLEQAKVGRLAVILDDTPVIFPVNHVVEWDAVLVRCDPGGKLAGLYEGAPVSYEIDELDPDGRGGWSVQAKGRAHPMHDPWDRDATPDPVADRRPRWVRIAVTDLTGRRLRRSAAEAWVDDTGDFVVEAKLGPDWAGD